MNNSTNSATDCGLLPSYWQAKDGAYFFVFYVFTPIYFFIAFIGHIMILIGFVKRVKTEPAYVYQIHMTVAKSIEIFFFTAFVIFYKWFSGIENSGAMWYKTNGVLMWYAAHAAVPMSNSCITTSLLVAVAMSADRVFGLWKPFVYRNLNTKRYAMVIAAVCYLIGWSTSIFDWFRFSLEFNGTFYVGVVNSVYVGGMLAKVLANLRNAVRAFGVASLILCNVAILYHFRKHASVKPTLGGGAAAGTAAEQKRAAERKATERTLVTIVIAQSILITASMSLFVSFYVGVYASPTFSLCSGLLFACIMDLVLEIGDVISFLIVAMVDKNVRQTIAFAVWCKKTQHTNKMTATVAVGGLTSVSRTVA